MTAIVLACAPSARPSPEQEQDLEYLAPPDDPLTHAVPSDPLSCLERLALPRVNDVFETAWSPDSRALAVTRVVTIPNARTITGVEEDQRLSIVDLATGKVRDLGQGSEPTWSGSGAYLSYWRDNEDFLRVVLGNTLAGLIPASEPGVRWVGDVLYFFHNGEIRAWKEGLSWTVANVLPELAPVYPRDDVYFSADGQQFTMTRYFQNGDAQRWIGTTSTGAMETLGDGNTLFTEWSPVGHTLLIRSATAVTLRSDDGTYQNADLRTLPGAVHGWTADGLLFFGRMSPTVDTAFDKFAVFGAPETVALLPNLLGTRAFSPDGRAFAGVTRTGLYSTQLDVYRCGSVVAGTAQRAETAARARIASVDADPRRFVRPVSGAITQYLQGSHTGIDVGAPFGSIIVAADDGVVDAVGWVPVGGRRLCVMHAGGLESCDYHTALQLVSIGDHVLRGQPVALIGMTGLTTGPHVHWEAKRNGMIVDPLKE